MARMTDEAALALLRKRQMQEERRAAEATDFAETLERAWPGARLLEMKVFLMRAGTTDRFRVALKLGKGDARQVRHGYGSSRHLACIDALSGEAAEELPF